MLEIKGFSEDLGVENLLLKKQENPRKIYLNFIVG